MLLLHGMGASHVVWDRFSEQAPAGAGVWLAIDLPGHGRAERLASYELERCAAAIGEAVRGTFEGERPLVVAGHSWGGALALLLGSGRFGVTPDLVFAVGIKICWTEAELAKAAALAERPAKHFETEADARAFFARVAGLGQASSGCDLGSGIAGNGTGWRLAQDPAANRVAPPPMAALVEGATCPVHLACGQSDPMVSLGDMTAFDSDAREIPGAGHNAMIDAPGAVWDWMAEMAGRHD